MKQKNVLFTGIASLICLGVLANCSNRMGEMKSRRHTCAEYIEWAQKYNKPVTEGCIAAQKPSVPPRGAGNGPAANGPSVDRLDQDDLLNRPGSGSGNGSGNGSTTVRPPQQPSGATTPANPAPATPGQNTIPGQATVPVTPGTPVVAPAPAQGQAPQEGTAKRADFKNMFDRRIAAPSNFAKKVMNGLTVSSGKEGNDVKIGIEAVVVMQNDAGVDEAKFVYIAKTAVVPFEEANIAPLANVVVKNNAQVVEDAGQKVLVFATCDTADCKQIDLMFRVARKEKQGTTDKAGFVYAVCAVETGSDKLAKCNFPVRTFAEAQTGLPVQVADGAQSITGAGNGAQSVTPGAPATQETGSAQTIESNNNMLVNMKTAQQTVGEQMGLLEAAVKEIEAAKAANDDDKAKAALTRAETALKGVVDGADMVAKLKGDLAGASDVAPALTAEATQISADVELKRAQADALITPARAAVSPAPVVAPREEDQQTTPGTTATPAAPAPQETNPISVDR